ncbi:MAG: HAD family phosphatase [Eudoraea sp.]|nr:HAD family phosphatase [Eudoraea sp.]NNL02413.1 HAD family phosphatase [Eudoraea sp.]
MIENIIFDFGDVFINLDKQATAREMEKFGFKYLTPELEELFAAYEKGLITTEYFLDQTSQMFPKAGKKDLMHAWNSIILDFPEERLKFIEKLAKEKDYRLFLLSNTNELHIDYVKQRMGNERFARFKKCFEKFYLSHEINLRKPERSIFEFVLNSNSLKAENTFFVDDSSEHTSAAAELSICCWHLKVGKEDILELKSKISKC